MITPAEETEINSYLECVDWVMMASVEAIRERLEAANAKERADLHLAIKQLMHSDRPDLAWFFFSIAENEA